MKSCAEQKTLIKRINARFYHVTACNATHGIATRKLSVRPSVKHVDCDKTKDTCAHILIAHERPFILVFSQEEWFVGGKPVYLKFWAKLTPLERKRRFLIDIRS